MSALLRERNSFQMYREAVRLQRVITVRAYTSFWGNGVFLYSYEILFKLHNDLSEMRSRVKKL